MLPVGSFDSLNLSRTGAEPSTLQSLSLLQGLAAAVFNKMDGQSTIHVFKS